MNCPTCGSPDPARHPALQPDGGEVHPCPDPFHLAALRDDTRLWSAIEHLRNRVGQARGDLAHLDAAATLSNVNVPVDTLMRVLDALNVVLIAAGPRPRRG